MSNQAQREMTLEELTETLPESHVARKQFNQMLRQIEYEQRRAKKLRDKFERFRYTNGIENMIVNNALIDYDLGLE